jgi:hypothetical protein
MHHSGHDRPPSGPAPQAALGGARTGRVRARPSR